MPFIITALSLLLAGTLSVGGEPPEHQAPPEHRIISDAVKPVKMVEQVSFKPKAPRQSEVSSVGGGSCDSYIAGAGIDNPSAAKFIFQKESGCNPASVNPSGCRGLGQACPGSKLPCGNDGVCQAKYFDGYAKSRYGSWAAAQSAWVSQGWW